MASYTIPEIVAPKAYTHSFIVSGEPGNFTYRKWSNKRPGRFNLILGVQEGAFDRWEAFKRERRLFS